MLINNYMQQDPETQARQALARVYALLIKLAESDPQENFVLAQNSIYPEPQAQEPQEVKHETKQAE
ncbi:MAG: hypothetical protein Fur002_08360 [Anaerolineales bacterium]